MGLGIYCVFLSNANRNDICMARVLLKTFDVRGKLILADIVGALTKRSSRIIAKRPGNTDWHTYRERHLVENLFLKFKYNGRFSTRYEKKVLCFHTVVCLACVLVWLLCWF